MRLHIGQVRLGSEHPTCELRVGQQPDLLLRDLALNVSSPASRSISKTRPACGPDTLQGRYVLCYVVKSHVDASSRGTMGYDYHVRCRTTPRESWAETSMRRFAKIKTKIHRKQAVEKPYRRGGIGGNDSNCNGGRAWTEQLREGLQYECFHSVYTAPYCAPLSSRLQDLDFSASSLAPAVGRNAFTTTGVLIPTRH